MTTSKNLRTVITIGGAVSSSLPSSTKRAVKELDRLKQAQAADVAEANNLKIAVRSLARGSDDYRLRVEQLRAVQSRIGVRTTEIGKVGAATRMASTGVGGLIGRLGALKAGLGPVGLALGGLVGIAAGLGAVFTKAGAEANSILLTSARFGTSTEAFQRGTAYLRTFTQDAGTARQQFESLLKVGQDFERVRYGEQLDPRKFLAASRLGINVNDLIRGELDPTALFERVAVGFKDLAPEEALLRAEVLLGPQLASMAAEVASGNLSLEDANRRADDAVILSDRQLRQNRAMGQNIDQIRQKISELLNQVTNFLIPPVISIAKFFGFDPERLNNRPGETRSVLGTKFEVAPGAAPTAAVGGPIPVSAPQPVRNRGGLSTIGAAYANYLGPGGAQPQARQDGQPQEHPRFPTQRARDFAAVGAGNLPTPRLAQDGPTSNQQLRGAIEFGNVGAGNPELVGRQTGGIVRPGEITLVGEQGPEIARFPGGTQIIRNDRVREFVRRDSKEREREAVTVPRTESGPVESGRHQERSAPPVLPSPSTTTQTFYVTITNPSSDLDIERSLADAAGKIGPGNGSGSA